MYTLEALFYNAIAKNQQRDGNCILGQVCKTKTEEHQLVSRQWLRSVFVNLKFN